VGKIKVLAACGMGMSISFMSQKIKAAAASRGLDIEVTPLSVDQMRLSEFAGYDIVILGPHVRYQQERIEEAASKHGMPVVVLEPAEYAMFEADKILERILEAVRRREGC